MNKNHLISQCVWLINTIYKAGSISFADIKEAWVKSETYDDQPLNRTKFNRLRDSVQILFGIVIECKVKGGYRYYIYNEEELSCTEESEISCSRCPCKKMKTEFFLCYKQKILLTKFKNE